jgi:hypothetical protein
VETKNVLTKALAIGGTIFAWFPIAAPILLSIIMLIVEHKFLFDYLMPMELFLSVLIGSGLLLWATLRAHSHVKLVAWGTGLAVSLFVGLSGFAEVTGLASGKTELVAWMWGIIIVSMLAYSAGVLLVGTGGVLLLRDLFRKRPSIVQ